jgi:ABC-type transport system involved in cytochrome c biogenesis permease subunit
MEPNLMLQSATGVFVVAALGGLAMAGIRLFGQRNPPVWLTMAHGLLAGAGLTLLIYAAFTSRIPQMAMFALLLFLVAAAGGIVMNLGYQWKQRPLPVPLMVVHALLAIVAFVMLLGASIG